jgi:hypothetical protein
MKHNRQDIVGKTISGVITRGAVRGRNPSVVMLQFSDGTYFEFVSPAALNALTRFRADASEHGSQPSANDSSNPEAQLAISGM